MRLTTMPTTAATTVTRRRRNRREASGWLQGRGDGSCAEQWNNAQLSANGSSTSEPNTPIIRPSPNRPPFSLERVVRSWMDKKPKAANEPNQSASNLQTTQASLSQLRIPPLDLKDLGASNYYHHDRALEPQQSTLTLHTQFAYTAHTPLFYFSVGFATYPFTHFSLHPIPKRLRIS